MILIIVCSIVLALIGVAEYIIYNELLLTNNFPMFSAIIISFLYSSVSIGSSYVTGRATVGCFDATREEDGMGVLKQKILLASGALTTLVLLTLYIIIRYDVIAIQDGFSGARYEGFYGHLMQLVLPIATTIFSFTLGVISFIQGHKTLEKMDEKMQKKCNEQDMITRKEENTASSKISLVYSILLPDADIPDDYDVVEKELWKAVGRKTEGTSRKKLAIFLRKLLKVENFFGPLWDTAKQVIVDIVYDNDHLSDIQLYDFTHEGSRIAEERDEFEEKLIQLVNQLIESISDTKESDYHVRTT